jgi:hypothetical protein
VKVGNSQGIGPSKRRDKHNRPHPQGLVAAADADCFNGLVARLWIMSY